MVMRSRAVEGDGMRTQNYNTRAWRQWQSRGVKLKVALLAAALLLLFGIALAAVDML
jgi:hypothetical protein